MSISRERSRELNRIMQKHSERLAKREEKAQKAAAPMVEMGEHWRKVVEKNVPFVLRWLALWIPPKWYIRFMETMIIQLSVNDLRWVGALVRLFCLKPFYGIKIFLQRFGMNRLVIRVDEERKKKIMTIRFWWRVVDETEWLL